MTRRRAVTLGALLTVVAVSSGCGIGNWQGLNSLPLPGTQGAGPDRF